MWRGIGVVGAGIYLPSYRLSTAVIDAEWSCTGGDRLKAVAGADEDATTMAVEAALAAVEDAGIDAAQLDFVWVGSESKPHAVRAIAATVIDAIGAGPWTGAADFEFACRGGAEAFIAGADRIESGRSLFGLVIATDTAQGAPRSELEKSTGAAAVAFVLGREGSAIARISQTVTFVSDTPDFHRRDGAKNPHHAHRFTGAPAYFHHVESAVGRFFHVTKTTPKDYRFAVFHQPSLSFPLKASRTLGFSGEQVEPLLLFNLVGNSYTASWALSAVAALDLMQPGDRVLISTYGSGAGADCFALEWIGQKMTQSRIASALARPTMMCTYSNFLRMTRQIRSDT